jgi:hypothetical protein
MVLDSLTVPLIELNNRIGAENTVIQIGEMGFAAVHAEILSVGRLNAVPRGLCPLKPPCPEKPEASPEQRTERVGCHVGECGPSPRQIDLEHFNTEAQTERGNKDKNEDRQGTKSPAEKERQQDANGSKRENVENDIPPDGSWLPQILKIH